MTGDTAYMMRFAVNYSPQSLALLESGVVDFDLFKFPDWPDLLTSVSVPRPRYIHFDMVAGKGNAFDHDRTRSFIDQTDTVHVNIHLAPSIKQFPEASIHDDTPVLRHRAVNLMLNDVCKLVDQFGKDNVVLENSMWDPCDPWYIPTVVLLPEVICQVVRESGAGFLMDIAHAEVTSRHFGWNTQAYIDALPTEQIREVHITGAHEMENGLLSDHYPLTDNEWELFEYALDRFHVGDWPKPRIIAFEYGGIGPAYEHRSNIETMRIQIPRLYEMIQQT